MTFHLLYTIISNHVCAPHSKVNIPPFSIVTNGRPYFLVCFIWVDFVILVFFLRKSVLLEKKHKPPPPTTTTNKKREQTNIMKDLSLFLWWSSKEFVPT